MKWSDNSGWACSTRSNSSFWITGSVECVAAAVVPCAASGRPCSLRRKSRRDQTSRPQLVCRSTDQRQLHTALLYLHYPCSAESPRGVNGFIYALLHDFSGYAGIEKLLRVEGARRRSGLGILARLDFYFGGCRYFTPTAPVRPNEGTRDRCARGNRRLRAHRCLAPVLGRDVRRVLNSRCLSAWEGLANLSIPLVLS
jgi:hypothetical protein